MNTMHNISINEILYEHLGSKITLVLIDSCNGDFYAKIVCQNVLSYNFMSLADERDVCAIFMCDLNITKTNKLDVLKRFFIDIDIDGLNECYVLSADSGESKIEIICDNLEVSMSLTGCSLIPTSLSNIEAFRAMFYFLDAYRKRGSSSDDIEMLLSDISP